MSDPEATPQDAGEAGDGPRDPGASFFLLPLLQLLVPGLAQLRRGQRWLGIVGLAFSALFWLALIVALVLALVNRSALYWLLTREQPLAVIAVVALVFALVWLVFGVLTTRTALGEATTPRQRWIVTGLVVLVTLLQVCGAGLAASTAITTRTLVATLFPSTTAEGSTPPQVEPIEGRYNILLLGGDAGKGRLGLRPDSISVVSVDAANGRTTIIGVPRNLEQAVFAEGSPMWGPFPNGYDCGHSCLISYLYTYGAGNPQVYSAARYAGQDPGMLAMRDAVEGVTGLEIPYIVLMDMNGFADLIDAIGGVEVDVPQETLAQDGKTTFRRGPQHMNGAQALLYSRTRYDSNDFGRMAKQRIVQQALLEQADPLTLLINFQGLASTGAKYIKTTIPQEVLSTLVEVALKAKQHKPATLELVPPTISVGHPDIPGIHRLVQESLRH